MHSTASTLQKLLQEERISFEIPPRLVESIKEIQDGEHKKAMDNVAKEIDKNSTNLWKIQIMKME